MQAQQDRESGAEQTRLQEDREGRAAWKKWGPYLRERQWGPCARTTAPTATPGITSATTTRKAVQGELGKLQEKMEEIVMEKVAEAVQKKAEEVQQQNDKSTEEKMEVL